MTTEDFEKHVEANQQFPLGLDYCVIAINEEAGEIAGWYKKAVLRGNKIGLTDQDLKEELGDVLYYLTRIAQVKGWTLSEVMDTNRIKLSNRRSA